jgi:general secretion pathway protein G
MANKRAAMGGFTLVELLVVISILGILAGIAVFAVSGVGDKGQSASCKTDYQTIVIAEEAYFSRAQPPAYATMVQLVPNYLHSASQWYDVHPGGGVNNPDYTITKKGNVPCPNNP